jgi:hypothetical protein
MGESTEAGVLGASVINTNDITNTNVPAQIVELEVGADKVGVLRMSGDGLGEHSKSTEVLRKMSGVNSL